MAYLEVIRKKREAEEIGENHPLLLQVRDRPRQPLPRLEAGDEQLVKRNGRQPDQSRSQGVVMKQRDTQQGRREEEEVNGDAET